MELGMIGLGRMGANMVRHLLRAGHQCVVSDLHPGAVQDLVSEGAIGTTSLADFARGLSRPRAIWLMVPAAVVDPTLDNLVPHLECDHVVIDGGNSHDHDDLRWAAGLRPKGIHSVEVGTSGGVWGLEQGYCLMIGGDGPSSGTLIPSAPPSLPVSRRRPEPPSARGSVAPPSMATCTVDPQVPATSSRWSTTV